MDPAEAVPMQVDPVTWDEVSRRLSQLWEAAEGLSWRAKRRMKREHGLTTTAQIVHHWAGT